MIVVRETEDIVALANLNKQIQDLHTNAYPHLFKPFDAEGVKQYFKERVGKPGCFHYGAFLNEQMIGFAQAEVMSKPESCFAYSFQYIHIHQVAVNSAHRNRGVGQLLLNKVCEQAQILGISRVDLTVWEMNESAISFYADNGFKTDLVRVFKYL